MLVQSAGKVIGDPDISFAMGTAPQDVDTDHDKFVDAGTAPDW